MDWSGLAALTLFSWLGKADASAAAYGDRGSHPAQGAWFRREAPAVLTPNEISWYQHSRQVKLLRKPLPGLPTQPGRPVGGDPGLYADRGNCLNGGPRCRSFAI
jgi:hypothetical protein